MLTYKSVTLRELWKQSMNIHSLTTFSSHISLLIFYFKLLKILCLAYINVMIWESLSVKTLIYFRFWLFRLELVFYMCFKLCSLKVKSGLPSVWTIIHISALKVLHCAFCLSSTKIPWHSYTVREKGKKETKRIRSLEKTQWKEGSLAFCLIPCFF